MNILDFINYLFFVGGLSHATRRFFLGDQSLCYSGTCEFFLMCWLGGGLIEGGCGGFLFACCHRSGRSHSSHDAHREEKQLSQPIDYGEVRNDPGKFNFFISMF